MLTICILNWQNWSETLKCAESILSQELPVDRLLIVENGSPNDSAEQISSWMSRRCAAAGFAYVSQESLEDTARPIQRGPVAVLLKNATNRGFAGGFNVALKVIHTIGDCTFAVLLNSDARLPPDFSRTLLTQFKTYPAGVGLIGPKILDLEDSSDWQRPERFRPNVWLLPLRALLINRARNGRTSSSPLFRRYWYTGSSATEVFMVHGSCLILTKALLGYQPLLDENVFLYWEEAILSDLVIAKGLKVWFDPELIVYHGWGKSTGSKLKAKHLDRSTKYYFESVQKIGFAGKAYLRAYLAALRFVRFVRADLT